MYVSQQAGQTLVRVADTGYAPHQVPAQTVPNQVDASTPIYSHSVPVQNSQTLITSIQDTGQSLNNQSAITYICWNIDGIKNKENDLDFITSLQQFDVIALLETWCHNETELENFKSTLPDYKCYTKLSIKSSRHGRSSGGIVIFIRNNLTEYFVPVQLDFDYGISFLVNNIIQNCTFTLIFVYLPPYGSKVYPNDEHNGIIHLEKYVNLLENRYPDLGFVISGDINARTKDAADFILDDNINYIPVPEFYLKDDFDKPRKSRDLHGDINIHGESLLNFCCIHNVHILNGRLNGDEEGHLTCFTSNGSSLVDYTIASTVLFPLFKSFEIGDKDMYTHLPQIFSTYTQLEVINNNINVNNDDIIMPSKINKTYYKWSENSFERLANSHYLVEFDDYINTGNINSAIDSFNSLVQNSCTSIKAKSKKRKQQILSGGTRK